MYNEFYSEQKGSASIDSNLVEVSFIGQLYKAHEDITSTKARTQAVLNSSNPMIPLFGISKYFKLKVKTNEATAASLNPTMSLSGQGKVIPIYLILAMKILIWDLQNP